MFKRVTWFTVGAAVGMTGTVVGYLRARELARRHVPENVSDAALRAAELADTGVRLAFDRSSEAIGEWRSTAEATKRTRQQAEAILRQQLERAGL